MTTGFSLVLILHSFRNNYHSWLHITCRRYRFISVKSSRFWTGVWAAPVTLTRGRMLITEFCTARLQSDQSDLSVYSSENNLSQSERLIRHCLLSEICAA